MNDPWLTLIGMQHDTAAALPPASVAALAAAEVVIGGARHLDLVGAEDRGVPWPIPFTVDPILAARGRRTVVLASGDPFWFGAGGSLVSHLDPAEWTVLPGASTFQLIAGHLGWRMEEITCHGLHAAPFARLRRVLSPHGRLICLLRDGETPADLAAWLTAQGAGDATLYVCERMGGAAQRVRTAQAAAFDIEGIGAPVAMAVQLPGDVGLSRASGLPDDIFSHDGQITKRPVRALTLSALAPRPGALLWDLGAGSGSVSVEWCLAGGRALAFERHATRAENIAQNIADFGIDHRMQVLTGLSSDLIKGQPIPVAVFIGGGGTRPLYDQLFDVLPQGTRVVANGVTLETEALLTRLHSEKGGSLLRVELASSEALGTMRGWQPARPVVQWSVTL